MMILITLSITAGIIYIVGIFMSCHDDTTENAKLHEGGFLNMGYITCDHRDLTPSDVRRSLIWPLRLLLFFVWAVASTIHDVLKGFLLIFNFRYGETRIYKAIDGWLSAKL
jgi:hypothetical protein